jgi:hypothetical protein
VQSEETTQHIPRIFILVAEGCNLVKLASAFLRELGFPVILYQNASGVPLKKALE